MTEHSTTSGNSTQLKRKAVHGFVLATEQQGWANGVSSSLEAEATQPPRKRRHADDIRTTGNDRLCSKDLLYGRKTLSNDQVTLAGNSSALPSLNSRKRKDKDAWKTGKVSTSEEALVHVSSELDLEAPTTKRSRIDQTEQSTGGEDGQAASHVAAVDLDSDEEQEYELPKYTIIPLPLSLRAQAYLQAQPQHGGQSKAYMVQQPPVSTSCGGSSSNALIVYNPDIHKRIECEVDCAAPAASSVSSVPCQSPGSTSSMDID
ncbi:hypothetical protein GGI17_002125 [Coemansia sp. S146]|nr:hypothetical protein GGI17_002125 [Coemansia sp. S146]